MSTPTYFLTIQTLEAASRGANQPNSRRHQSNLTALSRRRCKPALNKRRHLIDWPLVVEKTQKKTNFNINNEIKGQCELG
jgi:hypothetical protein